MIQTLIFCCNAHYDIINDIEIYENCDMGRKPKYGKPMTATERSRLRRQRLKEEGIPVVHFSLDGDVVNDIDELVEFFELSGRAQVISDLLKRPLHEAKKMMHGMKTVPDMPEDGDLGEFNEVASKVKKTFWDAVCMKINNEEGDRISKD